jgi:AcrR family transcriptional regulator
MPKIRTFSPDEKLVAERREQIAKCAAHLFVKKGFDRTGIREIAKACNMTIGNLYHYIGKKEDIIFLALKYGLSQNYAFVEKVSNNLDKLNPVDALTRAIDHYFRHIDNTKEFTTFLYRELKSFRPIIRLLVLESEASIVGAFEKVFIKGCEEGEFVVNDVRLIANNIVTLGEMWAVKQWIFKKQYTIDEYIKLQTEQILRQLCAKSVCLQA